MSYNESFLRYLRFEKQYSERTVQSYTNDLDQFALYSSAHCGIGDIGACRHSHIRSWIVHLMTNGYSHRSINRKMSTLRSYYKYLLRHDLVKVNPMTKIESLKQSKRLPKALPEKVITQVLSYSVGGDFGSVRDLLIVDMLYSMGLRRAELIELKIADVDMDRLEIRVLGKGNKERIVPITIALQGRISSYMYMRNQLDEIQDAKFLLLTDSGKKLYPKFVYNKVRALLGGCTTSDARSPHVLRHSFATHMSDQGADLNSVKEILGHASLASTEVYLHNTIERLKSAYKGAHPRA